MVVGRSEGYYRNEDGFEFFEEVDEEENCLSVGNELDEGVYEVERVVKRRKQKVCLVVHASYDT